MFDLIILTTAINRNDIHKKTLLPISNILKKYKINTKWIINLDIIKSLNEENTQIKTINFLKTHLSHRMCDLELIISEYPCFFKAVRNITIKCKKYIEQCKCLLYSEDDWLFLNENINNFVNFIKNYQPCTIINMGKLTNFLLGFKPTLWCPRAFNNYFIPIFESLHDSNIGNPEKYFRKKLYNGKKNHYWE